MSLNHNYILQYKSSDCRMCSRGVFQLQKLTLFFCDFGGSSAGVRDLITSPKISTFMRANPQIKFEVICKRNHHPFVRGTYVNGYHKQMPLRSLDEQQTLQSLHTLRNQLGRKAYKLSGSRVYGQTKSIQGKWQPNLFNTYPRAELTGIPEIPDVPSLMDAVEKQVITRKVRPSDQGNSTMKQRTFTDHHQSM